MAEQKNQAVLRDSAKSPLNHLFEQDGLMIN